jgi:hypothetical protein
MRIVLSLSFNQSRSKRNNHTAAISHWPVATSFASHGTRSASGCCFEPCSSSSPWRQCQPPPKISCQWTRLALREGTVQDKLFRVVFLADCSLQRVIDNAKERTVLLSEIYQSRSDSAPAPNKHAVAPCTAAVECSR